MKDIEKEEKRQKRKESLGKAWNTTKATAKKVWPYVKVGTITFIIGSVYGISKGYIRGRKDEAEDIGENFYLGNNDCTEIEDRICSRLEERLEETYDEHIDDLVSELIDLNK